MNIFAKVLQVGRNAFKSGRPLRYVSRACLVKSGLCTALTQRRRGYTLRFFPTIVNGAIHFCGQKHYQAEEDFIRSMLREGDCMIDVGCNIGLLSLAAKTAVGESGRCIAFEANPLIAHYARCNSELNGGSIDVVNAAIGDTPGLIFLSASSPDDVSFVLMQKPSSSYFTVAQHRLDDLIPEGRVRLLKIDVEGFELNVLKGSRSLLDRCDFIWLEICDSFLSRFGASATELIGLLHGHGFQLFQATFTDSYTLRVLPESAPHDFGSLSMYLAARPEHIFSGGPHDS